MANEYVLQSSMDLKGEESFSVLSKRHLRVIDSQNGSYNTGQVNFDLASISNSGSYIDWKQSYIEIPVCIQGIAVDGNLNQASKQMMFGLKNGYFSLINSMSLTLSNMSVISLQPHMSGRITYELLQNFTAEDAAKALQYGFVPEDLANVSQADNAAAASANLGGQGEEAFSHIDTTLYTEIHRPERAVRQSVIQQTNHYLSDAEKNVKQMSNVQGAGLEQVTFIMARIPMSILHSYFLECPLGKNSVYSLEINTNAPASLTITNMTGTTYSRTGDHVVSTSPYGFNPIQVGAKHNDNIGQAATSLSVDLTIGRPKTSNLGAPVQQCSLYVHTMRLSPEAEKQYLAEPVKTFRYLECQTLRIQPEAAGSHVVKTITNSLSRLRKMVILPYYAYAVKSPFNNALSGSLSSPFACLKNFQVKVSGMDVYPQPLTRGVEFYHNFKADSLNGGIDHAQINTSLISQAQYEACGGAIVVDLSNHDASEDDMSKSITIEYEYGNTKPCELFCYTYYEKEISIDCEQGRLVL